MLHKYFCKNRWIGTVRVTFAFLSTTAAPCHAAALRFEAPQKVARGDAFVAKAVSDVPVSTITFHWRGKKYELNTETYGSGSMATVLLPVPVTKEDKPALTLRATANKLNAQHSIALFNKERPVQKLTVEGKFVNPPAHEMERIANDRRKANAATSRFSPQRHWTLPTQRPVPGDISSLYGLKRVFNGEPRGVHRGLDMRGTQGTPIKATADGEVALAEDLYFSGNAVYLDHGQGFVTAYLHMSEILVQQGQQVTRGQTIGLVGATGRVTGPHLHLTFFVQGVAVDPEPLMEQKPVSKKTAQQKSAPRAR